MAGAKVPVKPTAGAGDSLVARLEGQYAAALTAARHVTDGAEGRDLTLGEETQLEQHLGVADRAEARLARLQSGIAVRREPLTYERGNGNSFFADLIATRTGTGSGDGAEGRLDRHKREMAVEMERRDQASRAEFARALESLSVGEVRAAVERRAMSTVAGAGGEFIPPLYLTDLFAPLARAGRVLAGLVRNIPLPGGTNLIKVPRVTTGALTGLQTADNAALSDQDMVTNSISCPVRTIAGASDVALQLLEQAAPLGFDEALYIELLADYNAQLAAQLMAGTGTLPQVLGVLNITGENAVTYTDASPTVPELQAKVADGASQAATARHLPPTALLMAPRRWFWVASQVDAQGRPLIEPDDDPPETDGPEGLIGAMAGLPVYIDSGIPTNLGTGTNEDRIIAARPADHLLFESVPSLRVNMDTPLAGSLGVKVTLHRYVAYTGARYPQGTSVLAGTGLATPSFP